MPRSNAAAANGTFTMNTDDQPNHSSSSPPASGPRPMPTAASAAQMAIALPRSLPVNRLAMMESVAGMISAAPTPMAARTAITWSAESAIEGAEAGEAEDRHAGLECALAPEAVAEGAEHEQETGEDEQVGVDHPLQLRGGGVELVLQRRQSDIENRVVEPDDHQAQRQHAERLPTTRIRGLGSVVIMLHSFGVRGTRAWHRRSRRCPRRRTGGRRPPARRRPRRRSRTVGRASCQRSRP